MGSNTLIKQGAKRVATWDRFWKDLPQEVRLALTQAATPESASGSNASLFPNEGLPPHEKKILSLLKADESTPGDGTGGEAGDANVVLGNLRRIV